MEHAPETLDQPLHQSKNTYVEFDKYSVRHWPMLGDLPHQVMYGLLQICVLVWFCANGWYQPSWYVEAISSAGVDPIWVSLASSFIAFDVTITFVELIMNHQFASNILWAYLDRARRECFAEQDYHIQNLDKELNGLSIEALVPPLGALSIGFVVLKVTGNPQCNALMLGIVLPWIFCNAIHGFGRNVVRIASRCDVALIELMTEPFNKAFPIAGQSTTQQVDSNTPEFWIQRLESVLHFQDGLYNVWSVGAICLFASLAGDGSQAFFCALVAATTTSFGIQVGFFLALMIVCCCALKTLVPLAFATSRCQAMAPTSKAKRSIRQLAGQGGTHNLSVEAKLQYMIFMNHMDRSDFGINIPVLGTVTMSLLIGKASILAAVIPTAFAVSRSYLQQLNELHHLMDLNHTGSNGTVA